MKKQEKSKDVFVPPQPGPDIAAFMLRIEQKLTFIEKKMDALLGQGPARHSSASVPQHRSHEGRHAPSQHSARAFEIKPLSVAPVPMSASQAHSAEVPQGQAPAAPVQGSGRGHSRERRERLLHKAVCADCQKDCEIPFKPSGERPVYCKECFSKRKSSRPMKPSVEVLPEAVPVQEIPEAPEPVTGQRKVTVTKKGVGRVTVSEIARPAAREVAPKAKTERPAPAKKSRR